MGLLSTFSRLIRNVDRIVEDVSPIVGTVAPFVFPGPGGFIISTLAQAATQSAPTRPPVSAIRAGASFVRPTCRPMGVVGRAFSAPFQARNFPIGGSFAGRTVVPGGRIPVGRDIVQPPACPTRFVPTPITPAKAVEIADVAVASAPAVSPVVVPPTIRIPSLSRFGNFNFF